MGNDTAVDDFPEQDQRAAVCHSQWRRAKTQQYSTTTKNYEIRHEAHDGRRYLVAPVVMMVEGVHSGSHGPILHLADELGRFVDTWNDIPIVVPGHPEENGVNVSAGQPHIIEGQVAGRVYNAFMDGPKLRAELWIDEEKIRRISPEALEYIVKGRPLDVSVGVFTDDEFTVGDWDDKHYEAIARNHRPDHLALLPGGVGACSWVDGCGVRANEDKGMTDNNNSDYLPAPQPTGQVGPKDIGPLSLDAYAKEAAQKGFALVIHELSFGDIAMKIQAKLDAMDDDQKLHFLLEAYEDYFVYEVRSRTGGEMITPVGEANLFKRPYEVQDNDTVEFTGEATAVTRKVEYVAMSKNPAEMEDDNMPKTNEDHKPCCPEKVELLIQSEVTGFEEGDREALGAMDETVIDKMVAAMEHAEGLQANVDQLTKDVAELKANAEKDKVTREDALKALKADLGDKDKLMEILPPETRAVIEYGQRLVDDERAKKIAHILENTNPDVFTEEKLKAMSDEQLGDIAAAIKVPASYLGQGPNPAPKSHADPGDGYFMVPGVE
jgi:hypothetical protein